MKRGDVVIAAAGNGFGSKPRPYVVVQSEALQTSLVILLGITGYESRSALRPRIEPSALNNIEKPSEIMADVPVTTRRENVDRVIGRLTEEEIAAVDRALLLILGLASTS